jgi:endonuclease YncB( thermonuclease family)
MTARSEKDANVTAAIRRHRTIYRSVRVFAACLIVSSIVDQALTRGDDWSNFDHRQFTLAAAIDGQTIGVNETASSRVTPIHLLGIASCTPHWDDRARAQLNAWVGRTICLKLEPTQTRDAQGRLLAYAFLDDATTLNADLVRQGLELAYRPQPTLLLTTVEQAEREARSKRRGLWNFVDNWEMPPWRRDWTIQERTRREKLLRAVEAANE